MNISVSNDLTLRDPNESKPIDVLEGLDVETPHAESGFYRRAGKRMMDIVVSVACLVLLTPLLCLLALLAALDGGPPLFSHVRIGQRGRPFPCHKFRSMVPGAEAKLQQVLRDDPVAAAEWARDCKLSNDPRVTAIGAFLRMSSLDELPQLFNVLVGEMSLVGPRPVTAEELRRYGAAATAYARVKPGVTGLWQVSGRNDLSYDERVALDVRYVRTFSFLGDISIMLRTALSILRMTGR